jgi:hypothetical protein
MTLPRVSPWHVLYLSGMTNPGAVEFPDKPVAWPGERSRPVLIRHGVAAPSTVHAAVKLAEFGFAVTLQIRVDVGGTIRVAEMGIHARETPTYGAITSRSLRSIRLDQIARDAVRQLEYRVSMREDVAPGAFQQATDEPNTYWVPGSGQVPGRRRTPREQAEEAARIYAEAVASGSRAPTNAVADALGYSRSQASRMIRTARDLGLLADTAPTPRPDEGNRPDASDQDD